LFLLCSKIKNITVNIKIVSLVILQIFKDKLKKL